MRQAIIIKNPKWEPFIAASDAFKKLKENETAVLVVRGRCKEKKQPKVAAKIAAVAALLLAVCLPSFAQQNIVPLLATTTLAGNTTNSTAGSGTLGWSIDQVAVVQLTVQGTNSNAAGVCTVLLDTSDNGIDWVAAQYSVAVTASGTNNSSAISRITNSVGGKYIRVGGYKNTCEATNPCIVSRFTLSIKEN